jgi:hypothetical protein
LPRDLGDVLHYFLPSDDADGRPSRAADHRGAPGPDRPAALPIVTLPIGDRDVVRAAFAWNLTVEIARLGANACLLAPRDHHATPLWPEAGRGPVGAEVLLTEADDLGGLNRAALDVAVTRAAESAEGGIVLVRVPPSWLRGSGDARTLLRWVLVFATPDARDQIEAYSLAKRVFAANDDARVGITVHGARRVADAERTFHHLAGVASRHLGRSPHSYGMLVDDLHIYRAIVARRPIGLEHPQSRAARTLRDVARLILEDARKRSVV